MRVAVILLLLVGSVVAVLSGRLAYEQEVARMQYDARAGYHATADVQSTALATADPQSGSTQRVVTVSWLDKRGVLQHQRLVVPHGRKLGATVTVWVDGDGRAAFTKPADSRTVATAFGASFLVLFGWIFALACAYGLLLVVLNRHRMNAWQREWRHVEPDWRKRVL